ncbi:MAG TPA: tetratricopeptide repeat protein [Acidobacteriota bacterium]|nr:tetratricopeptide repeat protein [Acidobacteriota bacterium]
MRKVPHWYEFGPYLLDPREHALLRGSEIVPLTPKAFDLLLVLVERQGHLIEKDELLKVVWPDSFVEEANLSYTVSAIRKALGDGEEGQKYIATVPKRGYRFVAPVAIRAGQSEAIAGLQPLGEREISASGGPLDAGSRLHGAFALLNRHKIFAATGAVLLLALGVIGLQRVFAPAQAIDSLAVLPFVNEGSNPASEYLSDGLTETLINNMSQIPSLRVIARTTVFRYKGTATDPAKAGNDLKVGAVVTGKVLQRGDTLIVQAELMDVAHGSQLWGQQYNRKMADIFALQDEIALRISENLRLKLSGAEKNQLTRRHTADPQAYQLYLQGRYHWNKTTEVGIRKGIEFFRRAVEKDPAYALAYAGLAESYYLLIIFSPPEDVMPKALAYARKALEIDDTLAEAHTTVGGFKDFYEGDWAGAEKEYRRALQLNPGYPTVHQRYSLLLLERRRNEESLNEIRRAVELDPVSLSFQSSFGSRLYLLRRYKEAAVQLGKAIDLDPNYAQARFNLGRVYIQMGKYDEAIAELKRALDRSGTALAELGCAYARSGDSREALSILSELRDLAKARYVSPIQHALLCACLGKTEESLGWLEKAAEERAYGLTLIHLEPLFDPVRPRREFHELVQRLGLPE